MPNPMAEVRPVFCPGCAGGWGIADNAHSRRPGECSFAPVWVGMEMAADEVRARFIEGERA